MAPFRLVQFKKVFDIGQTQANFIGITLYLSVCVVGIPLSAVVIPRTSPTALTAACAVSSLGGYTLLYTVARGLLGRTVAAFGGVLAAIVLILVPSGVLFSLAFGVMVMRPGMYGSENIIFVTGVLNVSLALGGVAAGALFHWTGLGLDGNMLALVVVQAVAVLPVTGLVFVATRAPTGPESESAPLLSSSSSPNAGDVKGGLVQAVAAVPNDSMRHFLWATLRSPRYYHTVLLIALKVGIGSTFTTNIGSAVAATLPSTTSQADVESKISLVVILLNAAQLVGRLLFTMLSVLGGNPNRKTVGSIMAVALAYIGCFWARRWAAPTYDNLVIITCAFGFTYGVMWCTSAGLVPFVPVSHNAPRVMAFTYPFAAVGTVSLNAIAGLLYDRHTSVRHECYGPECYRESDLVMMAVSAGLFLAAALRWVLGVPDASGRW
jgi:hypothetical protein